MGRGINQGIFIGCNVKERSALENLADRIGCSDGDSVFIGLLIG